MLKTISTFLIALCFSTLSFNAKALLDFQVVEWGSDYVAFTVSGDFSGYQPFSGSVFTIVYGGDLWAGPNTLTTAAWLPNPNGIFSDLQLTTTGTFWYDVTGEGFTWIQYPDNISNGTLVINSPTQPIIVSFGAPRLNAGATNPVFEFLWGSVAGNNQLLDTWPDAPPTTYSVSASVVGGNGSVSCDPTSVSPGGSSTCTAVPAQDYQVSGWTGDCAAAGTSAVCNLVDIQANQSSTVSFEAIPAETFSVAASVVGGNGSVSCDPTSVSAGGSSTCTALPDPGYQVSGWTGDCAAAGTSPVCNLEDIQAAPSFTVNFAVIPAPPVPSNAIPVPGLSRVGIALLSMLLFAVAAVRYRW